MIPKNTKLKELPKGTKFASVNLTDEDIILGEYLIATLLYNGVSLNQLLECTNEIEDKKERKDIKDIITQIALDFINLNSEYIITNEWGIRNLLFWI